MVRVNNKERIKLTPQAITELEKVGAGSVRETGGVAGQIIITTYN